MIFDKVENLMYRYGNRKFWCRRGYYVDAVGKNKEKITEYVRNHLDKDRLTDQLGLKELIDPFRVELV